MAELKEINKKPVESEEPEEQTVRSLGLTSLNEAIHLTSTDPGDSLESMGKLAISLLKQVKKNNGSSSHWEVNEQ